MQNFFFQIKKLKNDNPVCQLLNKINLNWFSFPVMKMWLSTLSTRISLMF
jgi:hypothetical protein